MGFSIYEVSSTKIQDYILHDFEGYEGNCSSGVRPLISLDMELLTGEGNGTENSPWELSK